tara:strand:+ start:1915 stop:2055 length:141 start_codon:yes stop_codon:yes gene_type:complete
MLVKPERDKYTKPFVIVLKNIMEGRDPMETPTVSKKKHKLRKAKKK